MFYWSLRLFEDFLIGLKFRMIYRIETPFFIIKPLSIPKGKLLFTYHYLEFKFITKFR